jgi:hypothetical protein
LVPDGLEAGEGIGEYTDPFMVFECGESRVHGDEFRPRDGAGLFRPRCVINMVVEVGMCTTAAPNLG